MPLQREKFLVYLSDQNGAIVVHPVTIHHVDMTRAETMLQAMGQSQSTGLNVATAWCWAALTRLGLYDRGLETFRDTDCQGLEDDGQETVDPTQPVTPVPSG